MKKQETINFLTHDQALDLVDRIAKRAGEFDYEMQKNEKEAMAQLLSDIGVKTSDLIDVSNLADNYAINAEIVSCDDYRESKQYREDCLFSWKDDDDKELTHYCLSW